MLTHWSIEPSGGRICDLPARSCQGGNVLHALLVAADCLRYSAREVLAHA